MRLADFDFPFDPALIAERPAEPRHDARLLVVPRDGGALAHRRVADLPRLLRAGDVLVVNDTKVIPARLLAHKVPGGGRVELLLVRDLGDGVWEVFAKGTLGPGQALQLPGGAQATVLERSAMRTTVRFGSASDVSELLRTSGRMPLPPYIKREPCEADRDWYQTVFAKDEGAIAAPTAGLHFTPELLDALRATGVRIVTVTLHVGTATFLPVKAERLDEHRLAPERVDVGAATAEAVNDAKARGGRVVAVGTTVVRTLEAAAGEDGRLAPVSGDTDLFVLPGYRFRVVDAMMTNFHLPRTTLLMLVSAFAGIDRLREAYAVAVKERYRFYSYGDAMLIV